MYTLFISTFNELITIGLLKDGKQIDIIEKKSNRNHSEFTVPMIETILKNNNINTNYLNDIIVVNGPGSFTGVRIGVTIAKTLAYTLDISIKTITSLEAFAVSHDSKDNKLDLEKIYTYLKNKDNMNPHLVNPIYIKGIDALNDK